MFHGVLESEGSVFWCWRANFSGPHLGPQAKHVVLNIQKKKRNKKDKEKKTWGKKSAFPHFPGVSNYNLHKRRKLKTTVAEKESSHNSGTFQEVPENETIGRKQGASTKNVPHKEAHSKGWST